MKVELVAHSVPNLGVAGSDTNSLFEGTSTYIDNVIEYSGRVCYKSTHRMGTAPNFVQARIREGHEDIVEHGFQVVQVDVAPKREETPLWWKNRHRYLEIHYLDYSTVLMAGNTRTWLKFLRDTEINPSWDISLFTDVLGPTSPRCFAEFGDYREQAENTADHESIPSLRVPSGGVAHLMGYCGPIRGKYGDEEWMASLPDTHQHVTIMWEGVSRALTHQLVRHRLLSFSQESQRYVSMGKGEWGIVIPPTGEPDKYRQHWRETVERYGDLRTRYKARKEDARFILPNMVQTRIVFSGTLEGIRHLFWLRCDTAAQWEIRQMAQATLLLCEQVWSGRFDDIKQAFPIDASSVTVV